jgi:hypothetical protein
VAPKAVRVGVLVNPTNAATTDPTLQELREAAPALGLQIQVLNASTIGERSKSALWRALTGRAATPPVDKVHGRLVWVGFFLISGERFGLSSLK